MLSLLVSLIYLGFFPFLSLSLSRSSLTDAAEAKSRAEKKLTLDAQAADKLMAKNKDLAAGELPAKDKDLKSEEETEDEEDARMSNLGGRTDS